MSASALSQIQTAIYAALNVSALTALVDRIGDSIPEGALPAKFVLLGEMDEQPDRTLEDGAAGRGHDVVVTIHSYCKDGDDSIGNGTAQAINAKVVELLDEATFTVAGHALITCELETTHLIPAVGGYRHVASDFRVVVEDA